MYIFRRIIYISFVHDIYYIKFKKSRLLLKNRLLDRANWLNYSAGTTAENEFVILVK